MKVANVYQSARAEKTMESVCFHINSRLARTLKRREECATRAEVFFVFVTPMLQSVVQVLRVVRRYSWSKGTMKTLRTNESGTMQLTVVRVVRRAVNSLAARLSLSSEGISEVAAGRQMVRGGSARAR